MNLNHEFTFDNFLVNNSNRLAFCASKQVAEKPGKLHNPLFIYGESCCGKTYLLHAIHNYVKENNRKKKILFIDCNEFINDFNTLQAILDNDRLVKDFNHKYHNVDVFLMDNIQFLANNEKAQLEFFNIFKELYFKEESSQFVLTADKELEHLGFIDDIMKKIRCHCLSVNIPLQQLLDYRKLKYSKQILDIIKEEVANYYNIPIEYVKMNVKERKKNHINIKEVSTARRIAMYLSMKLTTIDSVIIANSFGIYDDKMSARAFIVYTTYDFDESTYKFEIHKLKPICQKKINDKIEEIGKSVDIVDIIKKYIPLEKRGKNYFGLCPFHKDTLPSLSVSSEKQMYKCFSCGASGNVITFVKDYEQMKSNETLEKFFGGD